MHPLAECTFSHFSHLVKGKLCKRDKIRLTRLTNCYSKNVKKIAGCITVKMFKTMNLPPQPIILVPKILSSDIKDIKNGLETLVESGHCVHKFM